MSEDSSSPLLEVKNLRVWFTKDTTFFGKPLSWVKAVDDVNFTVRRGETMAIVGESGSGKTTTSLAILRALQPREGSSILFRPNGDKAYDLAKLSQKEIRPLRREMQMIFQDPFASLNPRMTLGQIVGEPLKVNKIGTPEEQKDKVGELLEEVGLSRQFLARYPHAFSGGQRQRIVVARALALSPQLIVCDEPVSALDVSVQAQILNLMIDLRKRYNLAYLFIAHDLDVVRHIADRVAVMYAGQHVEQGTREEVFDDPLHPYTQSLLASAPRARPERRGARRVLRGEVPDPSNLPSGCPFHPRCPKAMTACKEIVPAITRFGKERSVRCLLYEDIPESKKAPLGNIAQQEEPAAV